MKLLFISLVSCVLYLMSTGNCPVKGDGRNARMQHEDSLKNRQTHPAHIHWDGKPTPVSGFITGKPDEDKYSDAVYTRVTGYVILVKMGGAETCNCHNKDAAEQDYHIELGATPNTPASRVMICEFSRYTKGKLTLKQLRALVGKQVTIEGYLFYDDDHWQNAYNSNPHGTDIWRGTCWEVHPAFAIVPVLN